MFVWHLLGSSDLMVKPPLMSPFQAAHNATVASRLLELMKRVDEKVADLMAANALKEGRAGGEEGGRQSSSINNGLKRLAQVG